MSRQLSRFKGLLIIAPLAAGLGLVFGFAPREPIHARALAINSAELDFGEAWESSAFPWSFTIANHSDASITIREFSSSCGCAKVEPPSVTIAPHASQRVTALLDLTSVFERHGRDRVRDFAVGLVPVVGESQRSDPMQRGWEIRGKVKPLFQDMPRFHRITDRLVRGMPTHVTPLTVRLVNPLERLVARMPRRYGVATATRQDAKTWRVDFHLEPPVAAGPLKFDLTLRAYDGGKEVTDATLPIHAAVEEIVQALPAHIDLGPLPLGQSQTSEMTFASASHVTFTMECKNADSAVRVVLHSDRRCELTVRATELGSVSKTVDFVATLNGGAERIPLSVRVQYYGIANK